MHRRHPSSRSHAHPVLREPLLSRDETIGFIVALLCALAVALLFLGLPLDALAEEPGGEGADPMGATEAMDEMAALDGVGNDGSLDDAGAMSHIADDQTSAEVASGADAGAGASDGETGIAGMLGLLDTSSGPVTSAPVDGTAGVDGTPNGDDGADATEDEAASATEDDAEAMGERLARDIANIAEGSAPAPSNPTPLIIVVVVMGVALAIAFIVSRRHAKPQKIGGTKGDIW